LFSDTETFSYSQFTRYIKGKWPIPKDKEDVFVRYLHNNLILSEDLIKPNLEIDVTKTPIQIDLTRLMAYPDKLNLLAFHLIGQEHLRGKFNSILTHSEAVPIAISFSQQLNIPWYSITFRQPSLELSRFSQYPYFVDQELVRTAFFLKDYSYIKNNRILIVSDYIRRGGFIDILFQVAEDNQAQINFLFAVIGIGTAWRRFNVELDHNIRVLHFM
jgi:adenine/guanine phosphoribosyltransferase-like PRPP-binding protein